MLAGLGLSRLILGLSVLSAQNQKLSRIDLRRVILGISGVVARKLARTGLKIGDL